VRRGRTPPVSQAYRLCGFINCTKEIRQSLDESSAVRDGEQGCSRLELVQVLAIELQPVKSPIHKIFRTNALWYPRRGGPLGTNSRSSTRKLFSWNHSRFNTRSRDDPAAVPSLAPR